MKATKSKDGKRRLDLTIKVRLDSNMAATLLTAYDYDIENETVEEFVARKMKLGKRKLLDEVRSTLITRGDEAPYYVLTDGEFDGSAHCDALAAALRTLWEFD